MPRAATKSVVPGSSAHKLSTMKPRSASARSSSARAPCCSERNAASATSPMKARSAVTPRCGRLPAQRRQPGGEQRRRAGGHVRLVQVGLRAGVREHGVVGDARRQLADAIGDEQRRRVGDGAGRAAEALAERVELGGGLTRLQAHQAEDGLQRADARDRRGGRGGAGAPPRRRDRRSGRPRRAPPGCAAARRCRARRAARRPRRPAPVRARSRSPARASSAPAEGAGAAAHRLGRAARQLVEHLAIGVLGADAQAADEVEPIGERHVVVERQAAQPLRAPAAPAWPRASRPPSACPTRARSPARRGTTTRPPPPPPSGEPDPWPARPRAACRPRARAASASAAARRMAGSRSARSAASALSSTRVTGAQRRHRLDRGDAHGRLQRRRPRLGHELRRRARRHVARHLVGVLALGRQPLGDAARRLAGARGHLVVGIAEELGQIGQHEPGVLDERQRTQGRQPLVGRAVLGPGLEPHGPDARARRARSRRRRCRVPRPPAAPATAA